MLDRITDRLVTLLATSPDLSRGLDGRVAVNKGLARQGPEVCGVYVCLAKVSQWGYVVGGEAVEMRAVWAVTVAAKLAGDPAALERTVATLVANASTVILRHMGDNGYWTTAQLLPTELINIREETDQRWETVTIPVEIAWDLYE
jgi:hypothetical protein